MARRAWCRTTRHQGLLRVILRCHAAPRRRQTLSASANACRTTLAAAPRTRTVPLATRAACAHLAAAGAERAGEIFVRKPLPSCTLTEPVTHESVRAPVGKWLWPGAADASRGGRGLAEIPPCWHTTRTSCKMRCTSMSGTLTVAEQPVRDSTTGESQPLQDCS